MKRIDHFVILGKKSYSDDFYFIDGSKTLPTLRKRFNTMRGKLINKPHDSLILCACDESRNILKIYDKFK